MISLQEKERLIKLVNHSYNPQKPELGRAGYCVITGYFNEKSLQEICSFYSITEDDAKHWWNEFGFEASMAKPTRKRSSKKNEIFEFLKGNIGEVLTPTEIAEACEISMPTMYNFINSNIGWFKKVKRGVYEIVDADEERKAAGRG
jgi:hypothetical protein